MTRAVSSTWRAGAVLVALVATACTATRPTTRAAAPRDLGWHRTTLPLPTPRKDAAQLAALLPAVEEHGWLAIGTIFHGGGRSSLAVLGV